MKLYKFRPLSCSEDFSRAKDIIMNGKFWHSNFPELNDPVEGSFTIFPKTNEDDSGVVKMIDLIYENKNVYKICSFSNEEAFKLPTLWGYYANGFKGVVIEIEVRDDEVCKVDYVQDIFHVEKNLDPGKIAKQILSRKLSPWEDEGEYRSIIRMEHNENLYKVGEITSVFFGSPYHNAVNRKNIYGNCKKLQDYEVWKNDLVGLANEKNFKCYYAIVKNQKVENFEIDSRNLCEK